MSIEHCADCNVAIDTDFRAEDIEYIDDVPYCFNCFCRRIDEKAAEDERGKIATIRLSELPTDN